MTEQSNAIAVRDNQLKHALMGVRKQIESLLQDKSRSDKFMASALVIAQDKTLSDCNPNSIVQALVGVAMSDLNVDRNIGQVYLIKYGTDVQLQIGYKGFIQLLYRAGWMCKAMPVYTCDHFKMSFDGWDNKVVFEPEIDARDEGNKDWVYENLRGIFVVSRNSETKDEYSAFLPKAVIEKLRLSSPNQTKVGKFASEEDKKRVAAKLPIGIWRDWYSEMATAKAIKKLAKQLPIGDPRVNTAIAADDKAEQGARVDYSRTVESGVVVADIPKQEEPQQKADINEVIAGNFKKEPATETVPTDPEKKPEGKKKIEGEDKTDWVNLLENATDDEAFAAAVNSIPVDALESVIENLKTQEMLNKAFKALAQDKQEQFADAFSFAQDVLKQG